MIILFFNVSFKAQTAARQIYIDIVKDAASQGVTIVNGGSHCIDLEPLTDDQISDLKICGKKGKVAEMSKGQTLRYAVVRKAYNIDKWYIPKPKDKFLINITGYTIRSLPDSWLPPPQI